MKQKKSFVKQTALIWMIVLSGAFVIGCGGNNNSAEQADEHQHDHGHSQGNGHSH